MAKSETTTCEGNFRDIEESVNILFGCCCSDQDDERLHAALTALISKCRGSSSTHLRFNHWWRELGKEAPRGEDDE